MVVLPTPPFCIATAIVRAKSAPSLTQAGRDRSKRGVGGRCFYNGRGVRAHRDHRHSSSCSILVVALFVGYQRGVIQPLMAEIFFFGTLLLVFRFHDQYTHAMQKYVHINAVLSVFVAIILAIVMGCGRRRRSAACSTASSRFGASTGSSASSSMSR